MECTSFVNHMDKIWPQLSPLGNALVLLSISRTPSLISPSNVLLLGIACADLHVGLVVQPLYIARSFFQFRDTEKNLEIFTIGLSYSATYLAFVSFANVTLLSIDRFLAPYLHLRYKEIVTVKRLVILLSIVWGVGAICVCIYASRAQLPQYTTRVITASFAFIGHFINIVLYYKIYRIVRHHQLQIDNRAQVQSSTESANIKNLKRSFINTFYVYLLFMACYLPYMVMAVIKSKLPKSVFEVSWTCIYANSFLNLLKFSWRIQGVRAAIKSTLGKAKQWLLCS